VGQDGTSRPASWCEAGEVVDATTIDNPTAALSPGRTSPAHVLTAKRKVPVVAIDQAQFRVMRPSA
jgi:hypothetical protein